MRIGEWPWLVLLSYTANSTQICAISGSTKNRRVVHFVLVHGAREMFGSDMYTHASLSPWHSDEFAG
jgi:hypothetical protein